MALDPYTANLIANAILKMEGLMWWVASQHSPEIREAARERLFQLVPDLAQSTYSDPLATALETMKLKNNAEGYRQVVLVGCGFTPEAIRFIAEKSDFQVVPGISSQGWMPPHNLNGKGLIKLGYYEAEGAAHESAHVYWHWRRVAHPEERLGLCRDLVTVSEMLGTEYDAAAQFAKVYVYGTGDFPGMYVHQGLRPRNLHDIDPNDLVAILDWEIFAGLASWTMGEFKKGSHKLPRVLWRYFEPMFTGKVLLKPYYL